MKQQTPDFFSAGKSDFEVTCHCPETDPQDSVAAFVAALLHLGVFDDLKR